MQDIKSLIVLCFILFSSLLASAQAQYINWPERLHQGEYTQRTQVQQDFNIFKEVFSQGQDYRLVFADIYDLTTKEIELRIDHGFFHDRIWAQEMVFHFAKLYKNALVNFEEANTEDVPRAWRVAFKSASEKKGHLSSHLLLGLNAHINHDMALALVLSSKDYRSLSTHKKDYDKFNQIFKEIMDKYFLRLALLERVLKDSTLPRGIEIFDTFKKRMILNMVKTFRENAWESALKLEKAQRQNDYQTYNKVYSDLEEESYAFAKSFYRLRILIPPKSKTVR